MEHTQQKFNLEVLQTFHCRIKNGIFLQSRYLIILMNNSSSLKQIMTDVSSGNLALGVKMNLNELSEARRVVVAGSLGISKCLQDRIGVQNLLLQ